jgi:hypothetical protein
VDPLLLAFEERLQEINAYLDLLDAIEQQVRGGAPKIGTTSITVEQQKILYSSVYLQLYNLVEATISRCIEAVTAASATGRRWQPRHLTNEIRREWVRTTARTHTDLNVENRLATTIEFCEKLIQSLPITDWEIEKGGGGSWDDLQIEAMTIRLGCTLTISPTATTAIKRRIREDRGALGLVKLFRNRLAHGEMSFVECGAGITVTDLKDMKERTAVYMREVVEVFCKFIAEHRFLEPAHRPGAGTPP